MANKYPILATGASRNWSEEATWSDTADLLGTPATVPTLNDNVILVAGSAPGAGAILTVDAAANCLNMDWTNAANSPTLAGSSAVSVYGNLTAIAAMTTSGTGYINMVGTTKTITSNTHSWGKALYVSGSGSISAVDALTSTASFEVGGEASWSTAFGMTVTSFNDGSSAASRTITFTGAVVINCTAWSFVNGTMTLNAGTSSLRVTSTGVFAGMGKTYYEVQLNGTSHTVSGSNTFTTLTRTGTAANTNTVTFTSGTTQTVSGTFTLAGNSRANQLLAQSSTLGTAATISAAVVAITNCDLMDITGTGAATWDLSAQTNVGNAGGNTLKALGDAAFPAAAAQAFAYGGVNYNWSTAGNWTSRVPLPQDDVTCLTTGITVTVDMPRIGKSITFTGTGTATMANTIAIYGGLTLASGMTWTSNANQLHLRGRASYGITSATKTLGMNTYVYAVGGTYSLQDTFTNTLSVLVYNGHLDFNDQNASIRDLQELSTATRQISLGNGTITITSTSAVTKWDFASTTGLTFNAEGSTIILTNSTANAQTFAGGGLTYNNVTVQGAVAYTLTISGSNTFGTVTIDRSQAAKTVTFTDGTTQTLTRPPVVSRAGTTVVTWQGSAAAGWNLAYTGSERRIILDYISVSRCTATPSTRTFYLGANSTDGGNNSGLIFTNSIIRNARG